MSIVTVFARKFGEWSVDGKSGITSKIQVHDPELKVKNSLSNEAGSPVVWVDCNPQIAGLFPFDENKYPQRYEVQWGRKYAKDASGKDILKEVIVMAKAVQ